MTDATTPTFAVTVKLPVFWQAQPAIWFEQAEAQFALRGISSDGTKYYHVLAALDQDTAARISDVIQNAPAFNKYNTLKERLLQCTGVKITICLEKEPGVYRLMEELQTINCIIIFIP